MCFSRTDSPTGWYRYYTAEGAGYPLASLARAYATGNPVVVDIDLEPDNSLSETIPGDIKWLLCNDQHPFTIGIIPSNAATCSTVLAQYDTMFAKDLDITWLPCNVQHPFTIGIIPSNAATCSAMLDIHTISSEKPFNSLLYQPPPHRTPRPRAPRRGMETTPSLAARPLARGSPATETPLLCAPPYKVCYSHSRPISPSTDAAPVNPKGI